MKKKMTETLPPVRVIEGTREQLEVIADVKGFNSFADFMRDNYRKIIRNNTPF